MTLISSARRSVKSGPWIFRGYFFFTFLILTAILPRDPSEPEGRTGHVSVKDYKKYQWDTDKSG